MSSKGSLPKAGCEGQRRSGVHLYSGKKEKAKEIERVAVRGALDLGSVEPYQQAHSLRRSWRLSARVALV